MYFGSTSTSFVVVYLDNILMYLKTYDDYVREVRKVLQALADAKMKIKPEKTEFHKTEVKFLGYIVSREGLKMDQKKIEAVTSWPKAGHRQRSSIVLRFYEFLSTVHQGLLEDRSPTHRTH